MPPHLLTPHFRRGGYSALVNIILLLFVGCASERIVDHQEEMYTLYVSADRTHTVYLADVFSLDVYDSIPEAGDARHLATLPNTSRLVLSCKDTDSTGRLRSYSLGARAFEAELPTRGTSWITVLEGGKYILALVQQIDLIDVESFTVIGGIPNGYQYIPTLDARAEVAIGDRDSVGYRIINVFTGAKRGWYSPHLQDGRPFDYLPSGARYFHAPSNRIFITITTGFQEAYFLVGDLSTGETILQHRLSFAGGDIALSNDRKQVAVSDPSNWGHYDTPVTLDFFDLESLTHTMRFTTIVVPEIESLNRISYLPGDSILLTAPGVDPIGGPFQLLELRNRSIHLTRLIPPQPSFVGGLTIGPMVR